MAEGLTSLPRRRRVVRIWGPSHPSVQESLQRVCIGDTNAHTTLRSLRKSNRALPKKKSFGMQLYGENIRGQDPSEKHISARVSFQQASVPTSRQLCQRLLHLCVPQDKQRGR